MDSPNHILFAGAFVFLGAVFGADATGLETMYAPVGLVGALLFIYGSVAVVCISLTDGRAEADGAKEVAD